MQRRKDAAWAVADMFSGRPNPRWSLTPDEVRWLGDAIRALQVTAEDPSPPLLGYRGLLVEDPARATGYERVRLIRGIVVAACAGVEDRRRDSERVIERGLVVSAKDRLDPDVYLALTRTVGAE